MDMDPEWATYCHFHGPDNFSQFPRHRTPVGIAQHDRLGSTTRGRLQGFERINGVCLITIKKMFGIVYNTPALRFKIGQALLNNA